MISDDILLYSEVSASSEKPPPSAYGNKYRDLQPDIVQRVRDLGTLSPKCFHQILLLRTRGTLWKRRRKECKVREDGGHQGNKTL